MRIYKYMLQTFAGECNIIIHKNCEILKYGLQKGVVTIWALVDPDDDTKIKKYCLYETGNNVDIEKWKYVDTFQFRNGSYILHLFEENKKFLNKSDFEL